MARGKPTPRLPVTPRGEATRRRLLRSAERLFGAKGYFQTSVVDITQRARVAQGTFYLYFPGKEGILRELVGHLGRELRRTIRQATAGLTDRPGIERTGMRTFLDFIAAHRDLYKIVRESEFVDPQLSIAYYRKIAEGYAAGLAEAARAGQIRTYDPEALAYCLMGVAHMVGLRWVVWEGRQPPEQALTTMLEFISAGLAPPP